MSWITAAFSSSIGKKVLMGLTGLFLCSFLIIHLSGNFQLFKADEGYAFNTYTVFMTSNPVIKTISYLLYFSILFHAVWGIYLAVQNRKARPVQYAAFDGSKNSFWASRWMGVLGTIILVFIVVHMSDFWYSYHFGKLPYKQYTTNLNTGELVSSADYAGEISVKSLETFYAENGVNFKVTVVKDLYAEAAHSFQQWYLVALYLLAMGALSFHLVHGFQSAFQTLGLRHHKYMPAIQFLSTWLFGVIIPLSFAAMPVYFFLFK